MVRLDDALGAGFMIGIAVAIEEQDGGRFDAERSSLAPSAAISDLSSAMSTSPSASTRPSPRSARHADQRPCFEKKLQASGRLMRPIS
jgi:hypothetical protein